jgi:hypothetical protein
VGIFGNYEFICLCPYLLVSHVRLVTGQSNLRCSRSNSKQVDNYILISFNILCFLREEVKSKVFSFNLYVYECRPQCSKAWIVFARTSTGFMLSNPTRGSDVCVRLLCVLL